MKKESNEILEPRTDYYSEKTRNMIMLRADLRFLLSNPKPEKSVCLAEGVLAQAVEFISDSVVDLKGNNNINNCDLFVSQNIDQLTLEQAHNTLKTDGNLYIEWSVRNPSQITPTLKLLESKGFNLISTHIPKPDPLQYCPYTWIPLGSPGAAEHLLMNITNITNKLSIKFILAHLRRLLWNYFPKLFLNYPWLLTSSLRRFSLCTVASKKKNIGHKNHVGHGSNTAYAISESNNLQNTLIKNWQNWGLGERPYDLSSLMLSAGGSSYNKLVSFVFDGLDREPKLVIKYPRTQESAQFISNEANILSELFQKDGVIVGIPRVLDTVGNFGYTTIIETFMKGSAVKFIINNDNFRKIALSATYWLVNLAKETKSAPPKNWHKSFVGDIISDIAIKYSDYLSSEMIEKTEEFLSDLDLPFLICEHRDFHPVNIFYDVDGKIGVIDWETSRLHGIPTMDMFKFLIYCCLKYVNIDQYPDRILEKYRLILDETTETGGVFKECLDIYTNELEIPSSMLPRLRLLFYLGELHWSYCIVDPPEYRPITSYLSYKLWQEEIKSN